MNPTWDACNVKLGVTSSPVRCKHLKILCKSSFHINIEQCGGVSLVYVMRLSRKQKAEEGFGKDVFFEISKEELFSFLWKHSNVRTSKLIVFAGF